MDQIKGCPQCNRSLPFSEFASDPKSRTGRYSWCKECKTSKNRAKRGPRKIRTKATTEKKLRDKEKVKEYDRKRYLEKKEQILKRNYEYRKTPSAKASAIKSAKKQRHKFKEKFETRRKTGKLIRDGEITKLPCRVCGSDKAEVHHRNYSDPWDIDWLCRRHHREEHQRLREIGVKL